jgi:NADPH-dependent curcumin reductase CurA
MESYRQIIMVARPVGAPKLGDFRLEDGVIPTAGDGQLLLRTVYLSLDPYMRGRMSDAPSYTRPIGVGEVMPGEVVAEIIESRHPSFVPGQLVLSGVGWRSHATVDARQATQVRVGGNPPSTALGVLGMPGFTAYSGMKLIGRPRAGETVVVAAASGPVGSLVGQLAQLAGARIVGIAGGPEKCAYLREELGFDAAIDHRHADLSEALRLACPHGIDIYFENVGGPVWEAVFPLLNRHARVPVCGVIAYYNEGAADKSGLSVAGMLSGILKRSLTIRGYINTEFIADHREAFLDELSPSVASGRIKYREDVVDGLEAAPAAFIDMLAGRNFGKALVKVS